MRTVCFPEIFISAHKSRRCHHSLNYPLTAAARCKGWNIFACSNAGIVGSNPTEGMDIFLRLFCVYVALCRWRPYNGLIPRPSGFTDCRNALCKSWGKRNVIKAGTKHTKRHAAGAISLELSIKRLLLRASVAKFSELSLMIYHGTRKRNYRSPSLVFFFCFLKDFAQ
jgi:hypothetical protein